LQQRERVVAEVVDELPGRRPFLRHALGPELLDQGQQVRAHLGLAANVSAVDVRHEETSASRYGSSACHSARRRLLPLVVRGIVPGDTLRASTWQSQIGR